MDLSEFSVNQTFRSSMTPDEQAKEIIEKHYDPATQFPLKVEPDGNCFLSAVSHSLIGTATNEVNRELRLKMALGLVRNRIAIIEEAKTRGMYEPGKIAEEIAVAATDTAFVRGYGILGFAYGANSPINISYPPENGANAVDTNQFSGIFPSAPEASLDTERTIKV